MLGIDTFWFELDFQNTLILISVVMNVILGGLIFIHRRGEHVNRIYVFNILCIVLWSLSMVFYRSIESHLFWWASLLYLFPTFIASSFLYFAFFFPKTDERIPFLPSYLWLIGVANIIVVGATLYPGLVLHAVEYQSAGENIIHFGPFYWAYATYISVFFGLGLFILARKLFSTPSKTEKRQLVYLLWGYLMASVLAMATNLTLPYLGYYELNWMGQVLTVFMVLPVTYAIFKHHLFNAKVIATEIITVSLWLLLFMRFLVSATPRDRLIDAGLLITVIVVGILLIRSVSREVQQRERIEKLAKDLEAANARLKELDQMKSEFLSIASHQLRAPITAIKGYVSLIKEGDYGPVPDAMKEPLSNVSESVRVMVSSIEDYLNVSRIEQNRMKYEFSEVDIADVAKKAVSELSPVAASKKIGLFINAPAPVMVRADIGKIKQVVTNLVDNAIKYTPEGSVLVTAAEVDGRARVVIADTGVGLAKEDIGGLFQKFKRTDGANQVNSTGTGLGLYVARLLVEGHGGKVWVESEGKGKGSQFIIEIPLKTKD